MNGVTSVGINNFHTGHWFVIKFVGDGIVQNKSRFCSPRSAPGRPALRNHSWNTWVVGQAFHLSFHMWDGTSTTFSLPFSSYDRPSSLLLRHHPTNGWDPLRRMEYPSSKAQINLQKRFEQRRAQLLWIWLLRLGGLNSYRSIYHYLQKKLRKVLY